MLQKEPESGTGMLYEIASQYPIPALLHYDCFQSRFSTCLAPYHYTDTAKTFPSTASVTQPPPPVPVKQIADGEVWDRCAGVSGRNVRILTRYLSLWDESRHRRLHYSNCQLFVLYILSGQLSPVVISVHGIEQIGNPHDDHRHG